MPGFEHASATLTVNLGVIAGNYRLLAGRFQGRHVGAAVKADAYGMGMARIAPVLAAAGCRTFFVAGLDEGINLRAILGGNAEIYVLVGLMPGEAPEFVAHDLRPVLNHLGQVDEWSASAVAQERSLAAALQVDTGMARLGLSEDEMTTLVEAPDRLDGVDVKLLMSHLACADQTDHPLNREQLANFRQARTRFPAGEASLANGAGIFLYADYHFDMARAGLALYGGNPLVGVPNPMSEVIHLKAKIAQIRSIDSPRTVGYGATHQVSGPTRIATVPVGYADGYPRILGNRGFAAIDGTRVPVVGRVSMDLITLDVSAIPPQQAGVGCEVTLMGGAVPVDELAAAAETIDYEFFTQLGRRYQRTYIGGA